MRHSLASLGFVLLLAPGCAFLRSQPSGPPTMYAHFINVGQADATLLEFPCGAVLIDAGAQDDAHVDTLVEYLEHFFDDRPERGLDFNGITDYITLPSSPTLTSFGEQITLEAWEWMSQRPMAGTGSLGKCMREL